MLELLLRPLPLHLSRLLVGVVDLTTTRVRQLHPPIRELTSLLLTSLLLAVATLLLALLLAVATLLLLTSLLLAVAALLLALLLAVASLLLTSPTLLAREDCALRIALVQAHLVAAGQGHHLVLLYPAPVATGLTPPRCPLANGLKNSGAVGRNLDGALHPRHIGAPYLHVVATHRLLLKWADGVRAGEARHPDDTPGLTAASPTALLPTVALLAALLPTVALLAALLLTVALLLASLLPTISLLLPTLLPTIALLAPLLPTIALLASLLATVAALLTTVAALLLATVLHSRGASRRRYGASRPCEQCCWHRPRDGHARDSLWHGRRE